MFKKVAPFSVIIAMLLLGLIAIPTTSIDAQGDPTRTPTPTPTAIPQDTPAQPTEAPLPDVVEGEVVWYVTPDFPDDDIREFDDAIVLSDGTLIVFAGGWYYRVDPATGEILEVVDAASRVGTVKEAETINDETFWSIDGFGRVRVRNIAYEVLVDVALPSSAPDGSFLPSPEGKSVDADGNLYVSTIFTDENNSRVGEVFVVSPTGDVLTSFLTPEHNDTGSAVPLPDGNILFISDGLVATIYDVDGNVVQTDIDLLAAAGGLIEFGSVYDAKIGPDGNLYVLSAALVRDTVTLLVYSPDFEILAIFAGTEADGPFVQPQLPTFGHMAFYEDDVIIVGSESGSAGDFSMMTRISFDLP